MWKKPEVPADEDRSERYICAFPYLIDGRLVPLPAEKVSPSDQSQAVVGVSLDTDRLPSGHAFLELPSFIRRKKIESP